MAPPIKRPIELGESGADCLAIQQGLHRNGFNTNARNGNWGEKSVADCAAFQKSAGIQPSGNVGQGTLDALWPLMSGDQQEGYLSYVLVAPAILRPLYEGDQGDDVTAVQRMLYRGAIPNPTNAKNGSYGTKTIADMKALQKRYGIQATGNMGGKTFTQLWQYASPDDQALYKSASLPSSEQAIRAKIVESARWSIAHKSQSTYAQVRAYPLALVLPFNTDCSGSTSCFYATARSLGAPDPNDDNFSGYGYTGTQKSNGTRVNLNDAKPGDLLFYGNTEGSQHVTMMLDDGTCYSFGSTPPKIVTPTYRPVDEVRNYL